MWLPPNSTPYQKFRWVEVARYSPKLDAVIREQYGPKEARKPVLLEWEDVEEYASKHDHTGIYTSIFHYDDVDLDRALRMGNLYFDFDSEDPAESWDEVRKVYNHLQDYSVYDDAIHIYFTGAKGFHLEIEAIALGVDASQDLPATYRFIAEDLRGQLGLKTLDFAVYDPRRMWRLPYSRHQKTGLYKNELPRPAVGCFNNGKKWLDTLDEVLDYCREPRPVDVPEQHFDRRSAMWYREYVAQLDERHKEDTLRKIEMFNKLGTALVGKPNDKYAKIVWDSAIKELKESKKGGRNHTLNRQAFRLYLLVESGNLSEEYVTNALTEIGKGIGLADREITATLSSARRAASAKGDATP